MERLRPSGGPGELPVTLLGHFLLVDPEARKRHPVDGPRVHAVARLPVDLVDQPEPGPAHPEIARGHPADVLGAIVAAVRLGGIVGRHRQDGQESARGGQQSPEHRAAGLNSPWWS